MALDGDAPMLAFEEARPIERSAANFATFVVSVPVLLSVVATAPLTALIQRHLGDRPPAAARVGRLVLLLSSRCCWSTSSALLRWW